MGGWMSSASASARHVAPVVLTAIWLGMIGVLAKWITWPPLAIVCARCGVSVSVLALLLVLRPRREPARTSLRAHWPRLLVSGLLLGAHWGTLFWAYKLAPVGPVVVAVFTFPLMASILEPFWFGARPAPRQIWAALLGLAGIALISLQGSETGADGHARVGVALGLVSALCFALRGIYSRKLVAETDAITIMAIQTGIVAILFLPALIWVPAVLFDTRELVLIAVLGVAFTALPHTVIVWALKRLSVAASGIIGSLQVLSGIALAVFFLGESPTISIWIGAFLVVAAVVWESVAAAKS